MPEMIYESGFSDAIKFAFNVQNNLTNKSDIRDYDWEYSEQFQKIRQFTKGLITRSIPVTFFQRRSGNSRELYRSPQEMYEIFDRDVRMLKMGKLYIDEYYINCYIVGSSKTAYDNGVVIKMNLSVLSDFRWHREMTQVFGKEVISPDHHDFDFLDYEYDYDYDYGTSANITNINEFITEAIAPFDFRIEFEGAWENPWVQVGDHNIYRVYTDIEAGERLIIDSVEKRVYIKKINGEEENVFKDRDRDFYIFEPMPFDESQSEVTWEEGKSVTITAYIERSEPQWI